MSTEDIDPRLVDLDTWSTEAALEALQQGQADAVAAVRPALPVLAAAVEAAAQRLRAGGRLVYAGAGTSARIGVQDGAELGPTFSWPRDRIAFVIAGGEAALMHAIEGAEDQDAAARIDELNLGAEDVVLALSASGATPFTLSAVRRARVRGALTIGFANNAGAPLLEACAHAILLDTGPEPIAGSTRLKAATAQKVALNLFSTLVMLRLSKVYRGLMVDMRPANAKLRGRAVRMVAAIAGCSEDTAAAALSASGDVVKLAALVAKGLSLDQARALLARRDGDLRAALSELG